MGDEEVSRQFSALGQPSRLAIVRLLAQYGNEGLNVGEISARINISGATLSHHLSHLTRCGLLVAVPSGRFIRYRFEPDALSSLALILENRFSSLPIVDKTVPESRPSFASMLLG
ncbi:MAG TPA: metalloregulator ArsR/SmtB family transcription factor [Burkholderiales bacterium]|nr:metalloregulator ArsR/SmtB family transcription factor [Burkholderiales bacterium]